MSCIIPPNTWFDEKDKINLIFLDIDGVLNCQLHYNQVFGLDKKEARKKLKKEVKSEKIEREEYYLSQLSLERVQWLNELCKETNALVVISSSWRRNNDPAQMQEILNLAGATFKVIGCTPVMHVARGCEIEKWLQDHCLNLFGIQYFDFYRYAIIDDDSDMLLGQGPHFFQTDTYSGLTPTTCYKIKRFFTHKTF